MRPFVLKVKELNDWMQKYLGTVDDDLQFNDDADINNLTEKEIREIEHCASYMQEIAGLSW
ncbi:MAG: hypothetical protein WA066_02795 [Candidatus Omnitrophota bacterium]